MSQIERIIETLQLSPHPEGGYFRETYRSVGVIEKEGLSDSYTGARNFSTGIYFLLTSDTFSAFHKIHQDEMWHFYDGGCIRLHMITPDGMHSEIRIGRDLENGELPQFVVPGGYWFAAEVAYGSFALAGCTVAPGFDFADFTMPSRSELMDQFPQHETIIQRLTRS